jgi:hypothetical protein
MYRIYLEAYRSIWFFQVRIKTKSVVKPVEKLLVFFIVDYVKFQGDRLGHSSFKNSDRFFFRFYITSENNRSIENIDCTKMKNI